MYVYICTYIHISIYISIYIYIYIYKYIGNYSLTNIRRQRQTSSTRLVVIELSSHIYSSLLHIKIISSVTKTSY